MGNIDLKKTHREHYRAGDTPELVDVPDRKFLMIDGAGDPNTADSYRDAVAALYPIAYGIRRAVEAATGDAYTVMPLEGLWWAEDMRRFRLDRRDEWLWTMMIGVPDSVSEELFAEVATRVTSEKELAAGARVRCSSLHEGRAVQIMHHGPYADEATTINELHAFIDAQGFGFRGTHHEIYLTDPRRTAPAKNRTIIRQPVG
jgi:hypothetical protein